MNLSSKIIRTLGLAVGFNGPVIKSITTGSASFSTGNIGANGSGAFTVAVEGVSPGDMILYTNTQGAGSGNPYIDGVYVSAEDTVTVIVNNSSSATFAKNVRLSYLWLDIT